MFYKKNPVFVKKEGEKFTAIMNEARFAREKTEVSTNSSFCADKKRKRSHLYNPIKNIQ